VPGFQELIHRFERSISVLGRSPSTFKNYSMHIAAIALHYGKIPIELDQEQIHRSGAPRVSFYAPTTEHYTFTDLFQTYGLWSSISVEERRLTLQLSSFTCHTERV